MPLPDNATLQLTDDLRICRLLNGLWQVSGAHGRIDPDKAVPQMLDYHDEGFTTWDLADHYGPAEDFIGVFRRALQESGETPTPDRTQAFTKWVPRPMAMTKALVSDALNLSRRRMDTPTLDLLQFHWWDYDHPGYLDALRHMNDLKAQGVLRHVALTNFDTPHLARIQDAGVKIVSNQVQFSIIDRRPEVAMILYCAANQVWLLPYGVVCGGLLSEKYLGVPEPGMSALNTASLRKYKNMIDLWGGWALFQELLTVLKQIANKHRVSISNVAVRYILDKPKVAGVIIGARLGVSQHRAENARVFGFALEADDLAQIEAISDRANDLYRIIGDCGDEYRRR
ncbi:MAG: aldo/keto reductase [bacterium]|nr:aldo/keto reductase [bacterium]